MTRVTELNYVTCAFGVKGTWAAGYHPGVDYRAAVGTPVFASKKGKVVFAGWGGWGSAYGEHVIVSSWHRYRFVRHIYAHLSDADVAVGMKVKSGQRLGKAGETGRTFGAHLHYEERHAPFGYYNHHRPVLLAWQPKDKNALRRILERVGAVKKR